MGWIPRNIVYNSYTKYHLIFWGCAKFLLLDLLWDIIGVLKNQIDLRNHPIRLDSTFKLIYSGFILRNNYQLTKILKPANPTWLKSIWIFYGNFMDSYSRHLIPTLRLSNWSIPKSWSKIKISLVNICETMPHAYWIQHYLFYDFMILISNSKKSSIGSWSSSIPDPFIDFKR